MNYTVKILIKYERSIAKKLKLEEIENYRVVNAKDLWKKMLRALFGTGHFG